MLLDKNFDDISINDIETLITNNIRESKVIDYKIKLPDNTRNSKKEFLADVSSFANSSGGHLIFGIKEVEGSPKEIESLQSINPDDEIQRLDNLLRTCIEPRIFGIRIKLIENNDIKIIIIRIPKSWAQPHVVSFEKHWRFYSRNSAGKYPLDVSELRTSFNISETIKSKINNFHLDRINIINQNETPILLDGNLRIVLHYIPISAFDSNYTDIIPTNSCSFPQLPPIHSSGYSHRYNFEGFYSYSPTNNNMSIAYTQLFRTGIIEAVTAAYSHLLNSESLIFPIKGVEELILQYSETYLNTMQNYNIDLPIVILLTIAGFIGFELPHNERTMDLNTVPLSKNILIFDAIFLNEYNLDLLTLFKSTFDTLWNSFGAPYSFNYDR